MSNATELDWHGITVRRPAGYCGLVSVLNHLFVATALWDVLWKFPKVGLRVLIRGTRAHLFWLVDTAHRARNPRERRNQIRTALRALRNLESELAYVSNSL